MPASMLNSTCNKRGAKKRALWARGGNLKVGAAQGQFRATLMQSSIPPRDPASRKKYMET
eukprot:9480906-Pyramimonas_sp.AAC.1